MEGLGCIRLHVVLHSLFYSGYFSYIFKLSYTVDHHRLDTSWRPQPTNTLSIDSHELHEDIQALSSEPVDDEGLDVPKDIHGATDLGEERRHLAVHVLDADATKTTAREKRVKLIFPHHFLKAHDLALLRALGIDRLDREHLPLTVARDRDACGVKAKRDLLKAREGIRHLEHGVVAAVVLDAGEPVHAREGDLGDGLVEHGVLA